MIFAKRIPGLVAVVAVACVALLSQSCSTSRKAAGPATAGAPVVVTAANLTSVMAARYGQWDDVYVPFRLNLESPARFSFSGRASMVRGRSLHMSLRVFGMEVAVVHAEGDTAWLLDKVHRYVCAVPLASLTARTGIDLAQMQDMLLGRAFYPGTADFGRAPLDVVADGDAWLLSPRRATPRVSWSMRADASGNLLSMTVVPEGRGEFVASFADFVTTPAGQCASELDIDGRLSGKAARAGIDWDMGKARWNEGRDDKWSVPSGYTEITPDKLVDILKQF